MAGLALCFGLPSEKSKALWEIAEDYDVPVSMWSDLRNLKANALDLFNDSICAQVKLVVLDRLYKPSSGGEPLPLAGAGTTLAEQLAAVRSLFPNAKVFFVCDQVLYLRNEVDEVIEKKDLPCNFGGYSSYAAVASMGSEGIAKAIKQRI